MFCRNLIIQAILLVAMHLHLQGRERTYFIEPKFHHGTLLKHSPKIDPLVKGKITIYEVNICFPATGEKEWSQVYRYPDAGFGYNLTCFNNPEQIGNAHTLQAYIRLPIFKTKYAGLYTHFGMGPCYFPVVYDSVKNPLNQSISSHINLYLHAGAEIKITPSPFISIIGGYGMNHYSFGNLKQPNVGFNVTTAYGSLNIALNKTKTVYIKKDLGKHRLQHEFWVWYAAGWKESHFDYGVPYFISTLSANYAIALSRINKIGFGIEYFFDRSLEKSLIAENETDIRTRDLFRPGINFSHELVFGDVCFISQVGRYIYSRSNLFGHIYYRGGLKYYFYKNYFAQLTLKAHLPAIADFVEWGIGYSLKSK